MSLAELAKFYMGKYGLKDNKMSRKEAAKAQQTCFCHTAASGKNRGKKKGGKR